MAKYEKYAEYQDSGLEWLGSIPSHWEVWKLNHFAPIITCGVAATPEYKNEGIPFLSAQNVKKKKVDLTKGYKFISQEKHNELTRNRKPQKGDILLSRVGTIGEGCIIDVDFEFSIFVSLTHLRLIQLVCVNEFFIYLTESSYVKALHGAVTLVGGGVGNLNVNDLREYLLPIPQLSEQQSIVNFLDHETAKIETLIAKQEKLIELLKEKRQAVISHAVTKGLNPDVSMKDSGVEWLGEVPEHWTVKPNKYLLDFVTSGSRGWAQYYADTGSLFFRIANLTRDTIEPKLESLQFVEPPQGSEGERSKIKVGDLLISITADLGSVCVADTSIGNGYVSQHIALCRPQKLYDSRWLAYYILSDTAKEQLLGSGYGGTKIQLSLEDIKELVVVVPSQEEQREIANYIDDKLNQFEHLINQAYKFVGTLRERRIALISSAVTGKIDVRNWQHPNEAKTGISS
ncbi:restriction endonuclease subunit S [Acinetobacter lwoffii]|uniref:restriction endonuclease subunit S n=1 Tax=Acinetobacter lwoffii TaxID=28090 RepID=UPI001C211486|nr:restriction endonuclease subunit S [Acinetobacter lwoffii]QXB85731.1 restriction endonuclease subunit S [Acinetobacter lwoffii]